jgi:serpin B
MRRHHGFASRLAVPALAAILATGVPPAAARGPEWGEQAAKTFAAGSTEFAIDLLQRVGGKSGNVFFSPYSVSTALAMARAGAGGETARQMETVLRLPADREAIRAFVPRITSPRSLPSYRGEGRGAEEPVYALSVANAVFPQSGWAFEESFKKAVAEDYGAEFRELDYKVPESARQAINEWVEQKTQGRIQDIVPAGLPAPDTRMALANAIHFKAQWEEAFREGSTAPMSFTVKPGTAVEAPTMRQTRRMRWSETDDATLLEIPYRGGDTAMIVVLPKAKDGLDAVVKALTRERLTRAIDGMKAGKVALSLPKFTFTSQTDLASVLQQMGMVDAFSVSKADFTGITKQEPLFIGAVLHKAFVAVDEKGTEAAAATVVLKRAGEAPRPDEPTPFTVDHPFLFLIRHTATGAPLFVGRVDDPTAK